MDEPTWTDKTQTRGIFHDLPLTTVWLLLRRQEACVQVVLFAIWVTVTPNMLQQTKKKKLLRFVVRNDSCVTRELIVSERLKTAYRPLPCPPTLGDSCTLSACGCVGDGLRPYLQDHACYLSVPSPVLLIEGYHSKHKCKRWSPCGGV